MFFQRLLPQLPNLVTSLRIVLVIPIAYLLLQADYRTALLWVLVAGLSDGLDGWLARVGNWRSRFGAGLDAFADKILLVVTFVCLWWQGLLPSWLVAVAVTRDLYLVIGGLVYNRWFERIEMLEPSRLSKCNTALQIALVVAALADAAWPQLLPAETLFIFSRVVLVTTVLSFIDYAWTWSHKARNVGLKR